MASCIRSVGAAKPRCCMVLYSGDTHLNEENRLLLIEKYPELYEDCKYFDTGDGWFKLIDDLSAKIMEIAKEKGLNPYATQVKEKYGTLRFYISGATDEILELIDEAERKSAETCELCGEPGKRIGTAWFTVRCDKCTRKTRYNWGKNHG